MKCYEFNTKNFEYYAIVGASSQEEALRLYEDVVDEIGEESLKSELPIEVDEKVVLDKLMSVCKDLEEKGEAMKDYNNHKNREEPYFILIDGDLS